MQSALSRCGISLLTSAGSIAQGISLLNSELCERNAVCSICRNVGANNFDIGIAAVSGSHLEKYYANIDLAIYQVIFIGLAALTVPHMCLLEWVAKNMDNIVASVGTSNRPLIRSLCKLF